MFTSFFVLKGLITTRKHLWLQWPWLFLVFWASSLAWSWSGLKWTERRSFWCRDSERLWRSLFSVSHSTSTILVNNKHLRSKQLHIKNFYFEIVAINGKSLAGHFDGLTSVRLWTSTVALTMHVMLFNLGYGALVFPIIAEILPIQNRWKENITCESKNFIMALAAANQIVIAGRSTWQLLPRLEACLGLQMQNPLWTFRWLLDPSSHFWCMPS